MKTKIHYFLYSVKHEDDMRKTLEKIEPNDMVGVDEIASKLNELSQQAKSVLEDRAQDIPKSNYSVLEKSSLHEPPIQKQDPYIKDDNLLAFID